MRTGPWALLGSLGTRYTDFPESVFRNRGQGLLTSVASKRTSHRAQSAQSSLHQSTMGVPLRSLNVLRQLFPLKMLVFGGIYRFVARLYLTELSLKCRFGGTTSS